MNTPRFLLDLLSLVYPSLCICCGHVLPRDVLHICAKCRYELPKTRSHLIKILSISEKFQNIITLEAIYAQYYFNQNSLVQKLIHSIKYDANKELAFSLGRSYAHELLEVIKRQQIDLIVPVPLHPNKEKERGYNQSFEIARGVSTVVDVPVIKGFLVRKNHTASLTHMTKSKRIKTLAHAYRLSKKEVSLNVPKHILLVDDVMTTGSTVIACFEALSLIPNCKISVLVIAVGQ